MDFWRKVSSEAGPRGQAGAWAWSQVVVLVALGIVGVLFIYSAQLAEGGALWKKQVLWLGLGACVFALAAVLDYGLVLKHAHWIYLAGVMGLLLVYSPLGARRFGALRWLDLGFFSFQPSELAKLGTLVMVASLLARARVGTVGQSLRTLGWLAGVVFFPIGLILLQPDLGSALTFFPMVLAMLYASRLSARFFVLVATGALLGVTLVGIDVYRYYSHYQAEGLPFGQHLGAYESRALLPLRDYQRERILSFAAPRLVDPQGIGVSWNQRQAEQAVGTGGWFGKGWTRGDQAQLGYLPRSVAHNDFIPAVIAEETGFAGSIGLLSLFAVLVAFGYRAAVLSRDRFGRLLCVGITVMVVVHVCINLGMTVGLVPITGLPLPLVSYGGSFVLSAALMQGLVQSVYRHRRVRA